ncbi:MAG TPA: hypothetical protein VN765_11620 [Candidatus Acidoferrum sp.]|nr:hypothetical protein [Candidatus Acidoferrum sp.]
MKFLIGAVILIGFGMIFYQILEYWDKHQSPPPVAAAPAVPAVSTGEQLEGLPPQLEAALEAAEQRGAAGLRDFLAVNRQRVSDPRLAWIELDYVLMVTESDPAEARKAFARVKQRLTPSSPVYSRMKQLEKTYEPAGSGN